jgi:pimeloyl-ACP methyl ester carboxylesterase
LNNARRVLFLPGAAGAAAFWHAVGRRLPATLRPTYMSWPGLGAEPADPQVGGLHDLVARVEAELDEPAHVVAQSMGGAVALRVALRRPALVRRLVLVATSGGVEMDVLGALDWRPAYRREYPHAANWITDILPEVIGIEDLVGIRAPTLLIWGDADPISPVTIGRRLAAQLPHARLEVVAGGAHDLAVTHAPELARLIAAHLTSAPLTRCG